MFFWALVFIAEAHIFYFSLDQKIDAVKVII